MPGIATAPEQRTTDEDHLRFCINRRDTNLAFADWLRKRRPDPDLVLDEIEAGASVQRQLLRYLARGGRAMRAPSRLPIVQIARFKPLKYRTIPRLGRRLAPCQATGKNCRV